MADKEADHAADEGRVGGLEVRGDDAGVEGVGCYAEGGEASVEGAGVEEGGDFRVAVAFPGGFLM